MKKEKTVPLPKGTIMVTLHKARDLEKKGKFGKADPYAVLRVGKEKFKSKTVDNNHNPDWNFDIKFDTNKETPQEVSLEVYDEDMIGKDDLLGQTKLHLNQIIIQRKIVNNWIPLQQCKSGEVLFSTEFTPYDSSRKESQRTDSKSVDSKTDIVTSETKQTKGVVEVKELLVKSKESVTITDVKTKHSVTV